MNRAWIEQQDVHRRRYAALTWTPLFLSRDAAHGDYGTVGHYKDIEAVRTVAVHLDKRQNLQGVGFTDLPHNHSSSTWDGYTPCDVRKAADGSAEGVYLALNQSFDGDSPSNLELNQDFVFALKLKREGDVWVRPSEGFTEVVKIERDATGLASAMLVRPEYLKDYLAARSMALLVASYRERRWVVSDLSGLPYRDGYDEEETDDFGRHSFYVRAIVSGGFPYGAGVAVFNVGRTDEWPEDEVPILGPETEDNTISSYAEFVREGEKLFSLTSERRLSEWIEPAASSPRIRYDDVPSAALFLTDAEGTQQNADALNNEQIGLWLFFRPTLLPDLLSRRGVEISWHTRFTASVELAGGLPVHFGTNSSDLVVAYAHDVARLPEWQRRIWAAHNTSPEGGLGELHASQVRAQPVQTLPPERFIADALHDADRAFRKRWGAPLLRDHQDFDEIVTRVHRFRSLDKAGFLSLAKDLARLSADLIDQKSLHSVAPPTNGQGTGSLRSLERVLATITDAPSARSQTSRLVGIYELRLGDAHLPSEQFNEAMDLVTIPRDISWLTKGAYMIDAFVRSFYEIARMVDGDASG